MQENTLPLEWRHNPYGVTMRIAGLLATKPDDEVASFLSKLDAESGGNFLECVLVTTAYFEQCLALLARTVDRLEAEAST